MQNSGSDMRDQRRTIAVHSDQALIRLGIAAVLRSLGHSVANGDSPVRGRRVDTAIIDLQHTTGDPARSVGRIREQLYGAHLIALGHPMRLAALANDADAKLELPRTDAVMLAAAVARRAIRPSAELVRAHKLWGQVTPRQHDVLRWVAIGWDNTAIATRLRIGERAVKAHISALLALFELSNRTQLALLAAQAGLSSGVTPG
jgi:two-component system, NarL family, nitrate/nitrite response regulator NarL